MTSRMNKGQGPSSFDPDAHVESSGCADANENPGEIPTFFSTSRVPFRGPFTRDRAVKRVQGMPRSEYEASLLELHSNPGSRGIARGLTYFHGADSELFDDLWEQTFLDLWNLEGGERPEFLSAQWILNRFRGKLSDFKRNAFTRKRTRLDTSSSTASGDSDNEHGVPSSDLNDVQGEQIAQIDGARFLAFVRRHIEGKHRKEWRRWWLAFVMADLPPLPMRSTSIVLGLTNSSVVKYVRNLEKDPRNFCELPSQGNIPGYKDAITQVLTELWANRDANPDGLLTLEYACLASDTLAIESISAVLCEPIGTTKPRIKEAREERDEAERLWSTS